jgi:uncharacterized protein DUF6600
MRKGILVSFFSLLLLILLAAPAGAAFRATVSISAFHDSLAPHGRWVVTQSYGEVWVPSGIDADWQPYRNGEWVWSDYGWTWVSYDPWGNIPFHYGTWVWIDGNGWVWIPGTVWAPAWVTWAWTDDCIGWAPVPATFVLGVGGYVGSPVVLPASRYVFVSARQFVGDPIQSVRLPTSRNATLLSHARTATRFNVSGGVVRTTADPPPSFVERMTGKHLQRVSIASARTHPTALAAAGHTGRVGVVAPARERALAIRTTDEKSAGAAGVANGRSGKGNGPARTAQSRRSLKSVEKPRPVESQGQKTTHAAVNTRSRHAAAQKSTINHARNENRSPTGVRSATNTRSPHGVAEAARPATVNRTNRSPKKSPEPQASNAHPAPHADAAHGHEAHPVARAAPAGPPPVVRQAPPSQGREPKQPPKPKERKDS